MGGKDENAPTSMDTEESSLPSSPHWEELYQARSLLAHALAEGHSLAHAQGSRNQGSEGIHPKMKKEGKKEEEKAVQEEEEEEEGTFVFLQLDDHSHLQVIHRAVARARV